MQISGECFDRWTGEPVSLYYAAQNQRIKASVDSVPQITYGYMQDVIINGKYTAFVLCF